MKARLVVRGDQQVKGALENTYASTLTGKSFRTLVAIAARFFPGRRVLTAEQAKAINVDPGYFNDCSDGVLMTTRGGDRFDRTFMEGFLCPGLGLEKTAQSLTNQDVIVDDEHGNTLRRPCYGRRSPRHQIVQWRPAL